MKALLLTGVYWDETFQRHHQFAKYLCKAGYEVYFVEHIVSSKFTFRSALCKIRTKTGVSSGKNERFEKLKVYNFGFLNPSEGVFKIINKRKVARLIREIGTEFDVIINYLPINTTRFILEKVHGKVIYDCVRDFENWGGYYKSVTKEELLLLSRADKVFTDSFYLTEKMKRMTIKQVVQFLPVATDGWIKGVTPYKSLTEIKKIGYFGAIGAHIDEKIFSRLKSEGYEIHLWGQIPDDLAEKYVSHGYTGDMERLSREITMTCDAIVIPYKNNMNGVIPAKTTQSLLTEKPVFISEFYDSLKLGELFYVFKDENDLINQIKNYNENDYLKKLEAIKQSCGELNEQNQYKKFISSLG